MNGIKVRKKKNKFAVMRSRSLENMKFGHLLLFCRGRERNVPKCKKSYARAERLFLLIKPIVLWGSRCRCRCRRRCLSSLLGSLSNNDDDDNERHKTMGLMSQNNTLHVRFTVYISLPSSAKQQREMTKS